MAIRVSSNSRFRVTQAVRFQGQETFGSWAQPEFMDSPVFTTIIADNTNEGRLDLLSQRFFGTPDYWWAIMAYNKTFDINWPRAGDEVMIPDPELVFSSL